MRNDADFALLQAELIASHRSFISKCDVTELTNNLSNRDDTLMLYLFTDYMEICKVRKSRAFNTAKSPTGNKMYKHIQLIPLSAIQCVYDIKDSGRAFAISINDELYSFNINDEMEKICYLKSLCKQLAENACRPDAVSFLFSCSEHKRLSLIFPCFFCRNNFCVHMSHMN